MVKRCLSADSKVCDRLPVFTTKRSFLTSLLLVAASIFLLFSLAGCLGGGGGGDDGGTPTVATPTFNPAPGSYEGPTPVSIYCATPDATVRYTTDGSVPTENSALYGTTPIVVNVTTTIKAIAYKSGMNASAMASGTFTITLPTVATPTFDHPAGTYTEPLYVTINCVTSGATIHYTTDGSTPSAASSVFTSPILVDYNTTMQIKALAVKAGYNDSNIAIGTFIVGDNPADTVATPVFNPPAGTYNSAQTVTISSDTVATTIYYTVDGSDPTTESAIYEGPITVGYSMTVKAIGTKEGINNSDVATATYVINAPITTPDVDHVGTYALRGFTKTIDDGVDVITMTDADYASFSGTFVLGETQLKQFMEISGVLMVSFEQNYSWTATSTYMGHIDTFTPNMGAYTLDYEISGNMLYTTTTITIDGVIYSETDSWEKISDSLPPDLPLPRNGITDGLRGSVGLMQY